MQQPLYLSIDTGNGSTDDDDSLDHLETGKVDPDKVVNTVSDMFGGFILLLPATGVCQGPN